MDNPQEVTIVISGKGFAQIFGVVILGNLTSFALLALMSKWNKTIKEEMKNND